jgi:hypothetical protein
MVIFIANDALVFSRQPAHENRPTLEVTFNFLKCDRRDESFAKRLKIWDEVL